MSAKARSTDPYAKEYTENPPTHSQQSQSVGAPSTAEQQSDNVAHALAGAGGGLLSMALTLVETMR